MRTLFRRRQNFPALTAHLGSQHLLQAPRPARGKARLCISKHVWGEECTRQHQCAQS